MAREGRDKNRRESPEQDENAGSLRKLSMESYGSDDSDENEDGDF